MITNSIILLDYVYRYEFINVRIRDGNIINVLSTQLETLKFSQHLKKIFSEIFYSKYWYKILNYLNLNAHNIF